MIGKPQIWLSKFNCWPRKTRALASVLIFLIIQLNFYFAWTSQVLQPRNILIVDEVYGFSRVQLLIPLLNSFFVNWARQACENNPSICGGCNLFCLTYDIGWRYFIDCETIAFTVSVFCISLLFFYGKGIKIAALRALEITSASILPLGLEVWSFDRSEFQIQTSIIQVSSKFAWFTNVDLLYVSAFTIFLAIALEGFRYAKKKSLIPSPH